jgi:molybdopterin-guanine dinucleotide biosynthesis protein A
VDRDLSALILAGGLGRRFGGDKLSALWRGQTLLDRVVDTTRALSGDVLILGPHSGSEQLSDIAPGVRLLSDAEPFAGPLVALADGLTLARHQRCLVVAGDMPAISADVLQALIAELDADRTRSVVAFSRDDRLQPVPSAVRVSAALRFLAQVLHSGERRLGAILEVPAAVVLPTDRTPLAGTPSMSMAMRDVDTREDLAALPA